MSDILCHCRVSPDGHEPGSVLDCAAPTVRPGRYRDGWCTKDHRLGPHPPCHGVPRGTCPGCGKYLKVVRLRGAGGLGMSRHAHGGAECPGVGQVPAETTYREGDALRDTRRAGVA